ncbi:MAG TPA: NAD(P)-binding domain-containing protein [Chitinophagaceae bacterium]|nr:NAD(P)-binding domain-containing protein [Chitinophagaceae bacterium]
MYNKNQKVGVLGSGGVGQVLASAFLKEGHQVMLGTRNTSKEQVVNWKNENPGAQTGTFAETAGFGELIILCVEGNAAQEVIRQAGIENFDGKVVIDTTNPIAKSAPENGVLKFFTRQNESLMEGLQQMAPGAYFVKAFNSVGNVLMYKPNFSGVKPSMFICGNNEEAKETVAGLLDIFGWETEDMGKIEAARPIESLCMLWCIPGFLSNQLTHAFRLLKA